MLATTLPTPSMPPSPPRRRAPRRKRKKRCRPSETRKAVEVLTALATMPTVAPTARELADGVGLTPLAPAPILDKLERTGLLERWTDWARPGTARVMLSARAAARLGLTLVRKGDRWDASGLLSPAAGGIWGASSPTPATRRQRSPEGPRPDSNSPRAS
jgi:hypothetical protein